MTEPDGLVHRLLAAVADEAPSAGGVDTARVDTVAALRRIHGAGSPLPSGERPLVDALCRQVDVRGRLSAAYGAGSSRLDPETDASDAAVALLAGLLLREAAADRTDGFGLKCLNSALKALELRDGLTESGALLAWAHQLVAGVSDGGGG